MATDAQIRAAGLYAVPNRQYLQNEFQLPTNTPVEEETESFGIPQTQAFTNSGGNNYTGEFKDDLKNGKGTFTWKSGNKHVGEYKDNSRDGIGTMTYICKDSSELCLAKYIGQFKKNLREGVGTNIYNNGAKSFGPFKNGKEHGSHTITHLNEDTQVALYENGKVIGY